MIPSRNHREIALKYMRSAPPTDLMGLAQELKIQVRYAEMGTNTGKIEQITENRVATFFINENHPENQQRFTLAHQIAHFILHHRQLKAGPIIDNAMYRSILPDPMEWDTNRYAAQLLMPFSAISKLWDEGIRSPAMLGLRMGVNEKSVEIRLGGLKKILEVNS